MTLSSLILVHSKSPQTLIPETNFHFSTPSHSAYSDHVTIIQFRSSETTSSSQLADLCWGSDYTSDFCPKVPDDICRTRYLAHAVISAVFMHPPQGLCQRESGWNKSERLFAVMPFNSSRESKAKEMSNE